ncbi:transglycosylase domain-containing protein [Halobacillus sp. B29]|uniref:transglycosylase domain-containing protein n=1 Tax=Halobacillus sp. B29 TaxID=3457432 RepID=UPI003FCE65AA
MKQYDYLKPIQRAARRVRWAGIILAILVMAGVLGYITILFGGRLVVSEEDLVLDEKTFVETKDGEVIEEIYTKNREIIDLSDVPEHVQEAFVAIEDSRFYEHSGIDFKSIVRAVYKDIIAMAKVEGASTITQQLAKNISLSNDKTWMRKTKEVMAAIYLERNFTKDEILELYLNRIYFGEGVYGIEAAAEHYFQSPASELTEAEGALLAGMPKAPNSYSPFDNPEEAKARRNLVLSRMHDTGSISAADMKRYQGATLGAEEDDSETETWTNSYVDLVIAEAAEKYDISRDELKRGGYRLIVEMDPVAQRIASENMQNGEFVPGTNGEVQGALTLMDHETGALRAVVGGRDFKHGDINRVLTSHQPASAIKPLAVYGPALMTEEYTPYTVLPDEKQEFADGWTPENYDGEYDGSVSLYQALSQSKNVAAVWLLDQMGIDYAKGYLKKLGLETKDEGLAIALGGLTEGYTPLQMAEGYRSFAQNGKVTDSYTITQIKDRSGVVIHKHQSEEEIEVFSPQTAWYMTEMLQSTVNEGTASAGDYRKALAGKTGTQQHPDGDNKDVWFAGYTPEYVGTLWMGYDQAGEKYRLEGGSSYPTRLMKEVLSQIDEEKNLKESFDRPEGVEDLPEPIEMPNLEDASGSLSLSGLARFRGTISWTPADDDRLVYRIYREEEGEDVKVGEVTGKGEFKVNAFGIFDQTTYYIVPFDPLTGREGEPSNKVTLNWDL